MMYGSYPRTIVVLVLLSAAWPPAANSRRTPQERPVFRTAVTLIPIDVRVIDSRGHPVEDLRREDFSILEDGKPQEIMYFARRTLPSGDVTEVAAPDKASPGDELSPQRGRIFIVMAGDTWLPSLHNPELVPALCGFFRERLTPQDRVAFVAFGLGTPITTRHREVADVIERVNAFETRTRFPRARSLYVGDDPGTTAEFSDLFGDARDAGNWLSMDASDALPLPTQSKLRQLLEELDRHTMHNDMTRGGPIAKRLREFVAVLQSVREIQGEKHLIWLPGGTAPLPSSEADKAVAALANDARVAVHVIFPHALNVGGGWETLRVSSLKTISEGTGGRALAFESVSAFLSDLERLTRQVYVLGYYPTDSRLDGRYRRIKVQVRRPKNAVVLGRTGYFAGLDTRH